MIKETPKFPSWAKCACEHAFELHVNYKLTYCRSIEREVREFTVCTCMEFRPNNLSLIEMEYERQCKM